MGQNNYWGTNFQQLDEAAVLGKMTRATQMWYDEVNVFDSQNIKPFM